MSDTLILNADGSPLSVLPLSIVSWQIGIRLLVTDKVRVLKEYDDWVVRSPSTTMHVPSVVMTTDYVKWNRKVKYSRSNVFLRDDHTCQLCGERPGIYNLSLDHVVPRSKGGKTTWTNIVTACKPCNSSKGNDETIVPKKMPQRPSYYQLVAKRAKQPVVIKDEYWKNFLPWDETLINFKPPRKGDNHGQTDRD
jgi:5-methylcytosine-specific restriction endonuclease McrA